MDATGAALLSFEVQRKLRDTIYGEVRSGIRLTPSVDTPNTYERVMTEVVAIKVSSKVYNQQLFHVLIITNFALIGVYICRRD
jgi:hypothetical protein